MDQTRLVYLVTLALSCVAILSGLLERRPDLIFPGLLSTIITLIMLFQSYKNKSVRIWVPVTLIITLVVGIINVTVTNFTEFAQFMLATPLFVAVGLAALCCLIAYFDIRLDRVMFSVYLLFLTLSVSNFFSYGVFIYIKIYGVADHLSANFWLVDEFAFVFTYCVLTIIMASYVIKKKGYKIIQSRDLLIEGIDPDKNKEARSYDATQSKEHMVIRPPVTRTPKEKKIDIACLIIFPSGFLIYTILTLAGMYGKEHEMIYIVVTEIILLSASMSLPLLRVTDRFITPYWFIAIIQILLYMHGSALYFGTYILILHWDVIAHVSASLVVTLIVFIAILVIQTYTKHIELGKSALLFMIFIIGFGFGNLWELLEWFVDSAFGYTYMAYSIYDTLGDGMADFIGSATMTILAAYMLRKKTPMEIISGFGLHNYMVNMGKRWDRKTDPNNQSSLERRGS